MFRIANLKLSLCKIFYIIRCFIFGKKQINSKVFSNMPKDIRKDIDRTRRFLERRKLLASVSDFYGERMEDTNKVLLLFEINKQRTYLMKHDSEFLIINDNRGDIRIVLRRPWERLKFIIESREGFYLINFEFFKPPLKVSKKLFNSSIELRNKIENL
jgi:hypothetical protein